MRERNLSNSEANLKRQLHFWKWRAEEAERKLMQESEQHEIGQTKALENTTGPSDGIMVVGQNAKEKKPVPSEQSPRKATNIAVQKSTDFSIPERSEAPHTPTKAPLTNERSPGNVSQIARGSSPSVPVTARRATEGTPTRKPVASGSIPRKASQLAMDGSPGTSSPGGQEGAHTPKRVGMGSEDSPVQAPRVTFQTPPGTPSSGRRMQRRPETPSTQNTFWKQL